MELGVSDGNFSVIIFFFGLWNCLLPFDGTDGFALGYRATGSVVRWNADEQETLIRRRPYAVLLRPLSGKLLPDKGIGATCVMDGIWGWFQRWYHG